MSVRTTAVLASLLGGTATLAGDLPSLQQPGAYAVSAPTEGSDDVAAAHELVVDKGALRFAQSLELVPTPRALPDPLIEESPASQPTTALARRIGGITLSAAADPVLVEQMRKIPDNFAIKDAAIDRFGDWRAPQSEATLEPPRFYPTAFHFAAPAVYSRPLYFEQRNVERYGHHVAVCESDNLTQSALSAAHFFATVPVLPYKMGAERPDECSYVLGSYRPGSCNPHQLLKPQLSLGGVALEGAAVAGLIFLIP